MLQCASPLDLSVLFTLQRPDALRVEALAHKLLERRRVRREWFNVAPTVAADAIKQAAALVDTGFADRMAEAAMAERQARYEAEEAQRARRSVERFVEYTTREPADDGDLPAAFPEPIMGHVGYMPADWRGSEARRVAAFRMAAVPLDSLHRDRDHKSCDGLVAALKDARSGDVFFVEEMEDLGNARLSAADAAARIEQRGIEIRVLDPCP